MKMYILILDDVPLGIAINSACHAAVSCNNNWYVDEDMVKWRNTSFKKVVCKVTPEQLKQAMEKEPLFVGITESALGGRLVGVAWKPRAEYHKCFQFLTMYR